MCRGVLACLAAACALGAAFAPGRSEATRASGQEDAVDRRSVLDQAMAMMVLSSAAVPSAAGATDLKKFNSKLSSLGLEEVSGIPSGFNALLESYSQSSPKLLVEFLYPNYWLVIRPSTNTNGEAGTVSAGDYGKGDSAALYVADASGQMDKAFYQKVLVAGISQRGDNQYQNFEVLKIKPGSGKDYALVDFEYELLTGAGFVVERRGVAGVTTLGKKAPALIAVTTAARWKKLEPSLRTVADSFRAYEQTTSADLDLSGDM